MFQLSSPWGAIDEIAKKAEEAVKAANAARDCITYLPNPRIDLNSTYAQSAFEAARKAADQDALDNQAQEQFDAFAPYFLSLCLVSLVLLDRLTSR